MTALPGNIEQILAHLRETSNSELEHVRALADGIRRADEQMLRDVRNVAMQHEVRREAIFGELQELASRLCVLPQRSVMTAVHKRDFARTQAAIEASTTRSHAPDYGHSNGASGGDWRTAAQKIDAELSEILNADEPRH